MARPMTRCEVGLLHLIVLSASGQVQPSSEAEAASFDCRRAILAAEKAVCTDDNLGSLDDRTAGMYFRILGSGAPASTITRVRQAQSRFIVRRNACGANGGCLVDAYTDQMMFLKNETSNLGL
jgi:uncharacterized protein